MQEMQHKKKDFGLSCFGRWASTDSNGLNEPNKLNELDPRLREDDETNEMTGQMDY